MPEDRSDYRAMTAMGRRAFLGSLFAAGIAAALPLPVGVRAEEASGFMVTLRDIYGVRLASQWLPSAGKGVCRYQANFAIEDRQLGWCEFVAVVDGNKTRAINWPVTDPVARSDALKLTFMARLS